MSVRWGTDRCFLIPKPMTGCKTKSQLIPITASQLHPRWEYGEANQKIWSLINPAIPCQTIYLGGFSNLSCSYFIYFLTKNDPISWVCNTIFFSSAQLLSKSRFFSTVFHRVNLNPNIALEISPVETLTAGTGTCRWTPHSLIPAVTALYLPKLNVSELTSLIPRQSSASNQ